MFFRGTNAAYRPLEKFQQAINWHVCTELDRHSFIPKKTAVGDYAKDGRLTFHTKDHGKSSLSSK